MSSSYGENFKVCIFGESHAPAIGVAIEGLPAGSLVDRQKLQAFLDRRAPGRDDLSTLRSERDEVEVLCGVKNGVATGAPISAIIRNVDVRSGDYDALSSVPRPGHADFPAQIKYDGCQDSSGGGHFSGRLTAPLCIAGGIALQHFLLSLYNSITTRSYRLLPASALNIKVRIWVLGCSSSSSW